MIFRACPVLIGIILLGSVALVPAQERPSFDCAKARSLDEFAICSDPRLSRLDALLGSAYATRLAALDTFSQSFEKAQQRDWLKQRTACSALADFAQIENCTSAAFLARLGELPAEGVEEAKTQIISGSAPPDGYFQFKLCNKLPSAARIAVAHRGSKDSGRFMIRGWYAVDPSVCTVLGEFPKGNFYFFAEAHQIAWGGDHAVCVKETNFARWDHTGSKCAERDLRGFTSAAVEDDVFEINLKE
jgi:uncharacterized protein